MLLVSSQKAGERSGELLARDSTPAECRYKAQININLICLGSLLC